MSYTHSQDPMGSQSSSTAGSSELPRRHLPERSRLAADPTQASPHLTGGPQGVAQSSASHSSPNLLGESRDVPTEASFSRDQEANGSENTLSKDRPNRRAERTTHGNSSRRLTVDEYFCPPESQIQSPFDTIAWERRTAAIRGDDGKTIFEQTNCEIPATWSQLATNVVASKYFYGENGTSQREYSVKQLVHRVARTFADWGWADDYFATPADAEHFYRELVWLCLHQYVSFNSPVWFNVGLYQEYGLQGAKCNWYYDLAQDDVAQPDNPYEYPQGSACFIQSVEDNMESIMDLARSEAILFKYGSGSGSDLSTLRSQREKLSGGGKPSGPLSFMRVYDQIAGVVKSGGKTRRAAKMQSLKISHPDIMEFVGCKLREEEKVRLLVAAGISVDEAYATVPFQNANLSVRLSDDFLRVVDSDGDWTTHWVTDPSQEGPTYRAKELFGKISQAAWQCGDPGVQYDTTINRWHTCPNSGRINASNPCSEYMFVDDSACNLASINLMRFREEDGSFNAERFAKACRIIFIAQEILVDHGSYPTAKIARNSHRFRPIGLGYSNLGSLIMTSGLPYDSDEARGLTGVITAILHGSAFRTSAELAAACGPFEEYAKNREPMLRVMGMHSDCVDALEQAPRSLKDAARAIWDDVLVMGRRYGFRNAQATVLAPTGTISFMMDCDTTGIEPDLALVKYKQLAGGGVMKLVNQAVPLALHTLGYFPAAIDAIVRYIDQTGTIEGAPELREEDISVFDCAFRPKGGKRFISWKAHLKMMSAAQPFLSGAISKTVNMPREATPEDIAGAFMEGWKLGLKAVAVYRDGSKGAQPLSTSLDKEKGKKRREEENEKSSQPVATEPASAAQRVVYLPLRERLPDTRRSITHKFRVGAHEGYITIGLFEDGRPGEVFITMAKEGSTIGGLMDCFGTAISMGLQYGVPLKVFVHKFSWTRFEPMGWTGNSQIRQAKSVVDYIFRWLGLTFGCGEIQAPPDSHDDHGPQGNAGEPAKLPPTSPSGTSIEASPYAAPRAETNSGANTDSAFDRNLEGITEGDSDVNAEENVEENVKQGSGIHCKTNSKGGEREDPSSDTSSEFDEPGMISSTQESCAGRNIPENERGFKKATRLKKNHGATTVSSNGNDHGVEAANRITDYLHGGKLVLRSERHASQAPGAELMEQTLQATEAPQATPERGQQFRSFQSDAPCCDNCGSITTRAGNCYLCHVCGTSQGCS